METESIIKRLKKQYAVTNPREIEIKEKMVEAQHRLDQNIRYFFPKVTVPLRTYIVTEYVTFPLNSVML